MELEQILKHLEWLDDERRKDKDAIAKQEDRIAAMEGNITAAHQLIKDLSGDIARLTTIVSRMDHFDEALLQQRVETNRQVEELEKQSKKRDEEIEKVRRVEMRAVDVSIAEVRKELEAIAGLKRGLQSRAEEEIRLNRAVDELRLKIQDMRRNEEEYSRTYKLIEDGRRQDSKRLIDMQGEVTAMRKRIDELRGQTEVSTTNFRKVEARLNELLTVEVERREAQAAFLDKQALIQVEFDRTWKDWRARIESIDGLAEEIEVHLQTLDATHQSVKRVKETTDELIQRIERRINEITEVQRLAEERFRQEWVTFKADDQKRWTNYTLTLEEQRSETVRNFEKLTGQVAQLDDSQQEFQDIIQQITEQSEQRLQSLLVLVHDWVSAFERAEGRFR